MRNRERLYIRDIYVYREGVGAGPHVGEIERGEWCTRRQSVLVCSGGGVRGQCARTT